MTLDDTLLPNLADWRPTGAGPHSYTGSTSSGWSVAVTAETADTVGCRLTELAVSRPAPATPATAAGLTRWAVRTAERVTGLLEPLALIEVDATRSEAVLRSATPARKSDDVQYYELLLRGEHSATLNRYQAPRTGPGKRRPVPYALTHEAITKVVADVAAEEWIMPPTNGPAVRSILDGLDRRQKELLLADLVRDLYGDLDGVETIVDARHEAVGYFMSLAARERYIAAALGYASVDDMPPEDRGPYLSPSQTIAYLESIAPSTPDSST